MDAPVSGGMEGANKGTLAMMVGGDTAVLEQARPVLEAMAEPYHPNGANGLRSSEKSYQSSHVRGH